MKDLNRKIEAQTKITKELFAATCGNGQVSEEYEKEFDKLNDMRRLQMAHKYRARKGLSKDAKTPYCQP